LRLIPGVSAESSPTGGIRPPRPPLAGKIGNELSETTGRVRRQRSVTRNDEESSPTLLLAQGRRIMKTVIPLLVVLLVSPARAENIPNVVNSTGFATLGWVFDNAFDLHAKEAKEDLYDRWEALNPNLKLSGKVDEFLDWSNISRVVVIYNRWHLPRFAKDIRIQHIEDNLTDASFGDRFEGKNPGGTYVLLLQYHDSDRQVLLSFTRGVFLVEDGWIGVVDIRRANSELP
jgi:hypothetical protein